MTLNGTVIATIAAGVAHDAAGNPNTASTSTDNTVTCDTTAPTVTINQAAGQVDPTNVTPINFTVVFSEAVADFLTGDVTLAGSAGATTAAVTGSGTTYTVAVSGMSVSGGTVIATIAAAVAHDAAGNANTACTSTDNTVNFDITGPTVTFDLQIGSDTGISNIDNLTNAASLVFDAIFNKAVVGFVPLDLSNAGSATGCIFAIGAPVINTYPVTVSACTPGTLILRMVAAGVTDTAGNPIAQTDGPIVTIDRTGPAVSMSSTTLDQPGPIPSRSR